MQVDVILTLGHILFGTAIGIIVTNHPQNFQAYPVLPVEPVKLAKFWCTISLKSIFLCVVKIQVSAKRPRCDVSYVHTFTCRFG